MKAGAVPGQGPAAVSGHRHGHRSRSLTGTFGPVQINVPRARLNTPDGKTTEWRSRVLPVYRRRTKAADEVRQRHSDAALAFEAFERRIAYATRASPRGNQP